MLRQDTSKANSIANITVIGASSGVGFAVSRVIASSSDSVHVIMAGRSLKKVNSAKSEIVAGDIMGQLSTLQLNIIDDESIALAVKEVQENLVT
jgi:NADP-dependent 3-hydroxy acid dehydrogenase YdfG